jgi:HAD superfamily hydrolase (TIGR01450 family)
MSAYDAALLDLDGVFYRGTEPIEHAAEAAATARAAGMRMAYVTNNASRTPEAVAALLRSVGVDASVDEVATSAQAGARLLAERFPAGSRVLVVGGEGLFAAVSASGLTPVTSADDEPVAVVQGYAPGLTYEQFAEAALAVRRGALWVATNLDSTVPSPRGLVPGNGALVAIVRTATGAEPIAAGKPARPLHDEAVLRTGAQRPLVVGDRLDTDIEGAVAVGADSLLVLTGVVSLADLLRAPAQVRPSYVGLDLRALLAPQPVVTVDGESAMCDGVTARIERSALVFAGNGTTTAALRAACVAAWQRGDDGVTVASLSGDVPTELAASV